MDFTLESRITEVMVISISHANIDRILIFPKPQYRIFTRQKLVLSKIGILLEIFQQKIIFV